MAIIKYKDSKGNIQVVQSIKGDKGPQGPRGMAGPTGPQGPTGPKGGTTIKGTVKSETVLKRANLLAKTEVGEGYIVENTGKLFIAALKVDSDGNLLGEKYWQEIDNFIPVNLTDMTDVDIDIDCKNGDVLVFDENRMQWVNKPFEIQEGALSLTESITIDTGIGLGGLEDGDVLERGTNFTEIIKQMARKYRRPEYKLPTLSITSSIKEAEIGSTVSPTLFINYMQNDGGSFKKIEVYRSGILIYQNALPINSVTVNDVKFDEPVDFKFVISYNQGPIKPDSDGNPYAGGRIEAGDVEFTYTIRTALPYWSYCTPITADPTVDAIRAIEPNGVGYIKEMSAICGENDMAVVFAYDKKFGDCISIMQVGMYDATDIFNKIELSIPDRNGDNFKDFIVYYYNTALIPLQPGTTFLLTLREKGDERV